MLAKAVLAGRIVLRTLGDMPLLGWLHNPVQGVLCRLAGHQPVEDACRIPDHDYCAWCGRSMPGMGREPVPPRNIQVTLVDGRRIPVECVYEGYGYDTLGLGPRRYWWAAVTGLPGIPVKVDAENLPPYTGIRLYVDHGPEGDE